MCEPLLGLSQPLFDSLLCPSCWQWPPSLALNWTYLAIEEQNFWFLMARVQLWLSSRARVTVRKGEPPRIIRRPRVAVRGGIRYLCESQMGSQQGRAAQDALLGRRGPLPRPGRAAEGRGRLLDSLPRRLRVRGRRSGIGRCPWEGVSAQEPKRRKTRFFFTPQHELIIIILIIITIIDSNSAN